MSESEQPQPSVGESSSELSLSRSTFGETLARFIDVSGIKQAELANTAGIDHTYLNKLIKGKTRSHVGVNTVLAIGEALRLDQDETRELLSTAGYSPAITECIDQLSHIDHERLKEIREKVGPATNPSRLNVTPLMDPAFLGNFADRLAAVIKINGTTQSRFARRIGMDPTLLNKIIQGERGISLKKINKIADKLGLSDEGKKSIFALFSSPELKAQIQELQTQFNQQESNIEE